MEVKLKLREINQGSALKDVILFLESFSIPLYHLDGNAPWQKMVEAPFDFKENALSTFEDQVTWHGGDFWNHCWGWDRPKKT